MQVKGIAITLALGAAAALAATGMRFNVPDEAVAAPAAVAVADVPYPDGYRDWTHVKSMLIEEGHPLYETFGGIHHIYANDIALGTLRGDAGAAYEEGAVFVFDLLDVTEADATIVEADRKLIGVMHKSGDENQDTGGWGFAAFGGDTDTAVDIDAAACFSCHQAKVDDGYVFAEWRQ